MKDGDSGQQKIAPAAIAVSPLPLPTQNVTMPPKLESKWNTKNLGLRLASDAVSAASAGALIAPIISIIDKSIMENASGVNTLGNSLRASLRTLALRPHAIIFGKPFALIFMLYGGTYLVANTLDTATATARGRPATHVTSGTAKFAASSLANGGMCVYKDQVFVRMFGPAVPGPPRPVPAPSYLLFVLRDCITIFASFNLPPLLGPYLDARLGEPLRRSVSGTSLAQFAAPAAVQLLSTPLHLLGLDLYNRPSGRAAGPAAAAAPPVAWRDRWDIVRKNWAISAAARICRIVPAFGVGGVVNTKVRRNLMDRLV